jgi:hypothetical protein
VDRELLALLVVDDLARVLPVDLEELVSDHSGEDEEQP